MRRYREGPYRMSLSHWLSTVSTKWAALPMHTRVLMLFALTVFAIELILRYGAPKSRIYTGWTKAFKAVGHVWTMVLLSLIYGIAVGPVRLGMLLARKDLLDRKLGVGTSAWREHVPNPLGPEAAARHQF
jgi:hypothetical protein